MLKSLAECREWNFLFTGSFSEIIVDSHAVAKTVKDLPTMRQSPGSDPCVGKIP